MIYGFQNKFPELSSGVYVADNATLMGQVTLEQGANIWYGAVLRGDQAPITIGENSNIQDNAVVHVSASFPVHVGKNVTVGHAAILHGCTVEDNCLIGMGAILLNGCVIGEGSLVAAGALVTQGKVIPPHSLVMGSPAKVVRSLTQKEIDENPITARRYTARAKEVFGPGGDA